MNHFIVEIEPSLVVSNILVCMSYCKMKDSTNKKVTEQLDDFYIKILI